MNLIKRYIDYLKNNPKGYWFKRKLYGWGWTPATWEGWIVLAIFILYITSIAIGISNQAKSGLLTDGDTTEFIIKVLIAVAVLIYICFKKGEKPRWQWGLEDKTSTQSGDDK